MKHPLCMIGVHLPVKVIDAVAGMHITGYGMRVSAEFDVTASHRECIRCKTHLIDWYQQPTYRPMSQRIHKCLDRVSPRYRQSSKKGSGPSQDGPPTKIIL